MPGVTIKISEDLPERIPLAAEFGPGFINVLVRAGLSQTETVEVLQDAWRQIREHYGLERIRVLEAS